MPSDGWERGTGWERWIAGGGVDRRAPSPPPTAPVAGRQPTPRAWPSAQGRLSKERLELMTPTDMLRADSARSPRLPRDDEMRRPPATARPRIAAEVER